MIGTHTARAWSCTVRLLVADERVLPRAARDLHALLAQVDAAASRFREDSALSRANRRAGTWTEVPPLLVDLVASALHAAEHTDGAVDPLLGRPLHRLGYDRDLSDLTDTGPAARCEPPTATWHQVGLDRGAGRLRVPAGAALDLGATAKARTADLAAHWLTDRHRTGVLVELGGDIAVSDGEWLVRVAEREGGDGPLLAMQRGGLATSTTLVRTWVRGGRRLHHILDPATGAPADGPWRTATVAAADALHANAASTAAIVLGDRAEGWLRGHGYAARLVDQHGAAVTTTGWPATDCVVAS